MLLTVACSLAAQSPEDRGKQDFHKDLTKQKFHLRPSVRMPGPQKVWIAPEREEKPCSVPLLSINPPSRHGTMTIIQPKQSGTMPTVKMPAPPCKDWPTE